MTRTVAASTAAVFLYIFVAASAAAAAPLVQYCDVVAPSCAGVCGGWPANGECSCELECLENDSNDNDYCCADFATECAALTSNVTFTTTGSSSSSSSVQWPPADCCPRACAAAALSDISECVSTSLLGGACSSAACAYDAGACECATGCMPYVHAYSCSLPSACTRANATAACGDLGFAVCPQSFTTPQSEQWKQRCDAECVARGRDGVCDEACNTRMCLYDFGDCALDENVTRVCERCASDDLAGNHLCDVQCEALCAHGGEMNDCRQGLVQNLMRTDGGAELVALFVLLLASLALTGVLYLHWLLFLRPQEASAELVRDARKAAARRAVDLASYRRYREVQLEEEREKSQANEGVQSGQAEHVQRQQTKDGGGSGDGDGGNDGVDDGDLDGIALQEIDGATAKKSADESAEANGNADDSDDKASDHDYVNGSTSAMATSPLGNSSNGKNSNGTVDIDAEYDMREAAATPDPFDSAYKFLLGLFPSWLRMALFVCVHLFDLSTDIVAYYTYRTNACYSNDSDLVRLAGVTLIMSFLTFNATMVAVLLVISRYRCDAEHRGHNAYVYTWCMSFALVALEDLPTVLIGLMLLVRRGSVDVSVQLSLLVALVMMFYFLFAHLPKAASATNDPPDTYDGTGAARDGYVGALQLTLIVVVGLFCILAFVFVCYTLAPDSNGLFTATIAANYQVVDIDVFAAPTRFDVDAETGVSDFRAGEWQWLDHFAWRSVWERSKDLAAGVERPDYVTTRNVSARALDWDDDVATGTVDVELSLPLHYSFAEYARFDYVPYLEVYDDRHMCVDDASGAVYVGSWQYPYAGDYFDYHALSTGSLVLAGSCWQHQVDTLIVTTPRGCPTIAWRGYWP